MQYFSDKNRRETLTLQNIHRELKKRNVKAFWVVLSLVIFTVLFLFIISILSRSVENRDFTYCLMWFLAGFALGCTTICVLLFAKSIAKQKRKITVVTDWLVDMCEATDPHPRHKNYTDFIFANYGRFRLYTGVHGDTNYIWSKTHAMSNLDICDYSNIDDEFYLVITDDNDPKILQIYNQKLFVMK